MVGRWWVVLVLGIIPISFAFSPLQTEFKVNTLAEGNQSQPMVQVLSDRFIVVWNRNGTNDGIFAQQFDMNGEKIGGEIRLDDEQGIPSFPFIAPLPEGFVVAWQEKINDTLFARVKSFDGQGSSINAALLQGFSTNQYIIKPTVVILPSNIVVGWNEAGNSTVYVLNGDLSVATSLQPIKSSRSVPAVSYESEVSFLRLWKNYSTPNDLIAQHFSPEGIALDDPFVIFQDMPGVEFDVVRVFDDHFFALSDSAGSYRLIVVQLPNGTLVEVGQATVDESPFPHIAAKNGRLFVVWHGYDQVYGQVFDESGKNVTDVFMIAQPSLSWGRFPSAAFLPDGRAIVAWQRDDEIFARFVGDDDDEDGIFNGMDGCPGVPGNFCNGCPDPECGVCAQTFCEANASPRCSYYNTSMLIEDAPLCSAGMGDNNYGTGGEYLCRGYCDGAGTPDYADACIYDPFCDSDDDNDGDPDVTDCAPSDPSRFHGAKELCNGIDENCNDIYDGEENLTMACGVSDVGLCTFGTESCSNSGEWNECSAVFPADEIFDNGLDEDCDGTDTPAPCRIISPIGDFFTKRSLQIFFMCNQTYDKIEYTMDGRYLRTLCKNCYFYKGLKSFRDNENNLVITTRKGQEVSEYYSNFTVDVRPPKLQRIEPSRGFAIDKFTVKYTEENCMSLSLKIQGQFDSVNQTRACQSGKNIEQEFVFNLSHFEGRIVDAIASVTDINGGSDTKVAKHLAVDTLPPHILSVNTTQQGRYTYWKIQLDDKAKYLWYVNLDTGKKKILCSWCNDYGISSQRKEYIKPGTYHYSFTAEDSAGNQDTFSPLALSVV